MTKKDKIISGIVIGVVVILGSLFIYDMFFNKKNWECPLQPGGICK